MKRFLLLYGLMVSALAANAQVTLEPKVKPETLVAGKQYVLVNQIQKTSQYLSIFRQSLKTKSMLNHR